MLKKDNIIVIGAGGHAKVVLSTLIALGKSIEGLVDDDPALLGTRVLGYTVLGSLSLLKNRIGQAAILAIGNNRIRNKLASTYPDLRWVTAVHPHAYIHDSISLGEGTLVCAGAIIQPESIIGNHVIINTSASVDHDCRIGDFAHIAPGTHLGGEVTIGNGTLVGLGSSAIYGVSIGKWSIIGAGSVVVRSINDHVYVKGIPAKEYKKAEVLV